MKIGEICALKWEDISLEEHCISVNKTMQRVSVDIEGKRKTKITVTAPKGDCRVRKIPISNKLYGYLSKFKRQDDAYISTGLPEKYLDSRTLQKRLKLILKACGISKGNFDMLRKTFIVRCVDLGFDINELGKIMGHSSGYTILTIYVHYSEDVQQRNMNILSAL